MRHTRVFLFFFTVSVAIVIDHGSSHDGFSSMTHLFFHYDRFSSMTHFFFHYFFVHTTPRLGGGVVVFRNGHFRHGLCVHRGVSFVDASGIFIAGTIDVLGELCKGV